VVRAALAELLKVRDRTGRLDGVVWEKRWNNNAVTEPLGSNSDPAIQTLSHDAKARLLFWGVPIKVVSERLGHAKASITLDIYAHSTKDMQEQAAEIAGSIMADCLWNL
jgi:integrase